MSVEKDQDPDVIAMVGASAALSIGIPFAARSPVRALAILAASTCSTPAMKRSSAPS